MKFEIKCASYKQPPCEGAIKKKVGRLDLWTIEISTIEELFKLKEAVGQDLILSNSFHIKNIYELMIYDDYVE
jgi:hypothetical protein